MESWSALYFTILFFACIARLHAPHGIEESSTPAHEMKPESSESPKPVTKTEDPKLSISPDDSSTQSQRISSSVSSATLELEEFVTPTVAPATPSYDIESSSPIINSASSIESYAKASGYVLASVILIPPSDPGQIQSSQGSQGAKVNKESVNTESAVPTKGPEVLSSFLDSTPPNPISSEPMPTPPTTTTAKEEEDSITAALKQAEEENKPKEEEMPSFDEFKRRVLQEEEEKSKQLNTDHASGTAQKPKKVKERKQSNYASVDCGAKILDHNNEASNADSVLVENKDLYMLNPCSAQVWFVVELCDLAQVKSIQIANFELFSSTPESFRVSVSTRYPTREWTMLGTFQAREERKVQTFPLDEPIYAKYFKVEMLSHFGSEHYCPLSLLRVYGSSMMEELEDHETDGQEDNDNTDSDSDVPVLPPEPGAKMEDEAKKQNLLERAADTVISLVKKITGNGHDKEKGDYSQGDYIQGDVDSELDTLKLSNGVVTYDMKSEDENKGKLVTLVGHEELKESPEDQSSASDVRNTSQGNSAAVNKSDEGSSWFEEANSQKESATTSVALSSCQLFSQLIGQYSLGCFMGRLLFSKSKHFTLSLDLSKRQNINLPNKTSCSVDAKEKNDSIENKEGDGQENIPGQEEPILEKPSVTESSEEGNTPSQAENQKFSTFTPEPPSINVELKSGNSVSQNLQFVETTSTSSRSVKPSHSIDSLQNSEVSDDKTPALEEVSVVTSVPLNSTQSASPSLAPQNFEVQESKESSVETVKEDLKVDNQQDVVQTPLPKSQSTVLDNQPVVSESKDMTPQPENALKPPDIPSESEGQGEKNASDKDKQADKEEQKSEYVPSECVSPNSIHMMSQSSPDIDVLETKLTDKDGREGTAQLPEETHVNLEKDQLPSVNGVPTSEVVINSASVKVEVADPFNEEVVSSGVQDQERNNDSTESSSTTVDSQSIDPTVEPTSSPTVDTADLSDSIAPLPAPPVTGEASLSSLEVVTASSESNLEAGMLSKAQQAATSSAGMASVTGSGLHKESIFVRLSNKIKALEQNLNMSTLYMEQLNQRYRKSLDELQKNSDKKVALLTNATKKAEAVINSQKEQITKLQSKLDNLTDVIADMKARMDPLNKEVMERHIIGLCIEVVLILVLFLVFARRRNNQEIPDSPRRAGAFMNGHGPPRLAIEDGRHYNDDMMDPAVSLSGREQLLRSFGKTSDPETIGSSAATESLDNKLCKADTCNSSESKRRRNRKRKASSTTDLPPDSLGICASNKPELTPVSQSSTDTPSPASLVSRTAGLLFFGARGFFGGFQNPWKQKKPSAVHSDPNIAGRSESNLVMKASFRSNNQGITRAKSLDSVPEEAVFREHVPPPPPPPLPSEFGLIFKRPPDCYYSKKGNVKNVTSGAMKYGKYGVLDTQLA